MRFDRSRILGRPGLLSSSRMRGQNSLGSLLSFVCGLMRRIEADERVMELENLDKKRTISANYAPAKLQIL
jgi:hypothetical protein